MLRAWAKFMICALLAAGLSLHAVHDAEYLAFAGPTTSQLKNAATQPTGGVQHQSSAISHCQSPAFCAFLPVKFSALVVESEFNEWSPGRSRDQRSTFVHRQFRPPRLPAHA